MKKIIIPAGTLEPGDQILITHFGSAEPQMSEQNVIQRDVRWLMLDKICHALNAAGVDYERFGKAVDLLDVQLPAVGLKLVPFKDE